MTMATVETNRPAARPADMGQQEAKEVTLRIKENFDSLGSMLVQARDRKAHKALGYRSFECYCQSEFGKSISSAYGLIEDAKVLAQLEARISRNYGEEVTLKFPASHLRPLKAIEDIDDKLKAIEYAQKLAASEGKKATKRHLELAVFEVSGKRSEDYKKAVESLGFKKGVTVELKQTLRGDRGIVTNVDKRGKISVVVFTSGAVPVVCDASELRILEESEKPARPLTDTTASKGDRVRIFAKGLEGRQGEIYTYKDGKQAVVLLDGETAPISIPYAELELATTIKKEPASDWNTELVWDTEKNTYYYFPQEDTIYSNKWPQGLALKPFSHKNSPIEFIKNWEDKFAGDLLECLITPARAKTLALAQAIELPEEEGKEFVGDLITSLSQLFPQYSNPPNTDSTNELIAENQRLQEQLAEAEACIQTIISTASTASALVSPESTDFLPENTAETSTPRETATHSELPLENTSESSDSEITQPDWTSILVSNNFTSDYHYTDDCTEEYRGWTIYIDPNGGFHYIDLNHPKKGAFCANIRELNLDDEDEILNWAKGVINQVEGFCPGQLSIFDIQQPNPTEISKPGDTAADSEILLETATADSIESERQLDIAKRTEKFCQELKVAEDELKRATTIDKREELRNTIKNLHRNIEELRIFATLRLNQTVWHFRDKYPGEIFAFWISPGGMTHAGVNWQTDDRTSKLHEPMYVISTETPVGLVDGKSEIE